MMRLEQRTFVATAAAGRRRIAAGCSLLVLVLATGCGSEPDGTAAADDTASGGQGGGEGGGLSLGGFGGGSDACKVPDSQADAPPPCGQQAPAEAFEPVVQWHWSPSSEFPNSSGSMILPLVGNFTDDNGDGAIDLCDTPDVLVSVVTDAQLGDSKMFLLSGDTGEEQLVFEGNLSGMVTPAFGDIDGDGLPEVISLDQQHRLVAFEHDGTLKWTAAEPSLESNAWSFCTGIALYDLEGDGSVEILAGLSAFDSQGQRLFGLEPEGNIHLYCSTPTAADLDGDGKLEVLFGHATYHADGSLYWQLPIGGAHPHVANFDADPDPEVWLTTAEGVYLVEADGAVVFGPLRPTDPTIEERCWGRPGVIHDFDGDGAAEALAGTFTDVSMYEVGSTATATPSWTQAVMDSSGLSTGTAFDFLGDGTADAIYTDEGSAYVFDGRTGMAEMTMPRPSATLIEYPVVADVDNDGSAEIVLVSNGHPDGNNTFGVTVISDASDRWIQARRIWNQHAYHVTNVREDGTIPRNMKPSWKLYNTYRANSPIDGVECVPDKPN